MDLADGRTTMTTVNDNQYSAERVPTELAGRAGGGIEVLLLWDRGDGQLKVVVDDLRTGGWFELVVGDGRQALDAFYHPFAYAAARGIAYRSEARPGGESLAPEPAAPASSPR
jgi:hypothetical protein